VQIEIPPKSARAFSVKIGQVVRVLDVQGSQVGDFVCFSSADYREFFSQAKTRVYNWKVNLSSGDRLYSNRGNVLFTIGEDRVGVHDLLFSPCSRFVYQHIYQVGDHTGCLEHLAEALREYNLTLDDVPDPFNLFMNTGLEPNGQLIIRRSPSQPGDYIDLRADMDCLVALSSCADDIDECNGGRCTELRVEILPA
jgi:uncharacterized protein YcgI (DUF1989 family)